MGIKVLKNCKEVLSTQELQAYVGTCVWMIFFFSVQVYYVHIIIINMDVVAMFFYLVVSDWEFKMGQIYNLADVQMPHMWPVGEMSLNE